MAKPASKRRDRDIMKLVMSDYEVEWIDDNGKAEFHVHFGGPEETVYEGGHWKVHVELPPDYPYRSPSIGFLNRIFHPNVDELSGSVCLDVINQTWSPMYDLVNIFDVFIPQLLRYPNAADPLNSEAASLLLDDPDGYAKKVKDMIVRYATRSKEDSSSKSKKSPGGGNVDNDDDVDDDDDDDDDDGEEAKEGVAVLESIIASSSSGGVETESKSSDDAASDSRGDMAVAGSSTDVVTINGTSGSLVASTEGVMNGEDDDDEEEEVDDVADDDDALSSLSDIDSDDEARDQDLLMSDDDEDGDINMDDD